jgi:hypothetical protein
MCTGVIAKVTSLVVEEEDPLEIDTGRLCILTRLAVSQMQMHVACALTAHLAYVHAIALAMFWKCPALLPLCISSTLKTRLSYIEPHIITQGCSLILSLAAWFTSKGCKGSLRR